MVKAEGVTWTENTEKHFTREIARYLTECSAGNVSTSMGAGQSFQLHDENGVVKTWEVKGSDSPKGDMLAVFEAGTDIKHDFLSKAINNSWLKTFVFALSGQAPINRPGVDEVDHHGGSSAQDDCRILVGFLQTDISEFKRFPDAYNSKKAVPLTSAANRDEISQEAAEIPQEPHNAVQEALEGLGVIRLTGEDSQQEYDIKENYREEVQKLADLKASDYEDVNEYEDQLVIQQVNITARYLQDIIEKHHVNMQGR